MALTHLEHLYFDAYALTALMKRVMKRVVRTGIQWKRYKGQ